MFFLRFCFGDAFGTDMFLQTDDGTHRNFYTEQFICADTFTKGVCAQRNSYTQTPLHTDVFTQKIASVLHKDAFAQQKRHAGAFTHRTLYAEKPLDRTTFAQKNYTKNVDTEKRVHRDCTKKITHRNFYMQKLYPEQLLH